MKNKYHLSGRTLVYEDRNGVKNPPADNLYLLDEDGVLVWSMSDVCNSNDEATLVQIIDERTFAFSTFFGLRFEIDALTLEKKGKSIVK